MYHYCLFFTTLFIMIKSADFNFPEARQFVIQYYDAFIQQSNSPFSARLVTKVTVRSRGAKLGKIQGGGGWRGNPRFGFIF